MPLLPAHGYLGNNREQGHEQLGLALHPDVSSNLPYSVTQSRSTRPCTSATSSAQRYLDQNTSAHVCIHSNYLLDAMGTVF